MPQKRLPKPASLAKQMGEDQLDDLELDGPITLSIGVARIFDWEGGGGKPQMTCNDVIKNFQKSNFSRGKDIVE